MKKNKKFMIPKGKLYILKLENRYRELKLRELQKLKQ